MAAAGATAADAARRPVVLDPEPLRFAPVSPQGGEPSVFYDECNKQVFVVRSGGTAVQVLAPEPDASFKLQLPRQGEIQSMRFSPDNKILAIRRSPRTIAFQNLDGSNNAEYIQHCKGRGATELRGFFWTYPDEIVFVTTQGLELYSVNARKRSLKLIKSFSVTVMWCCYSAETKILVLASSPQSNVLHPFYMEHKSVVRIPKVEIDLPPILNQNSYKLPERDVVVARLYNKPYIMAIKNNPRGYAGPKAEVVIYMVTETGCVKTDTLRLDLNGRFMINVVDSVVIVHHQTSKTSLLFDIKAKRRRSGTSDGSSSTTMRTHLPLMAALPMAPATVEGDGQIAVYADSWIAFPPNIIIDARLGALWRVHLSLSDLIAAMTDKVGLVDVLLRRAESKELLMGVLVEELFEKRDLAVAAKMLELITSANSSAKRGNVKYHLQNVTQNDLYNTVFSPLSDDDSSAKYLVGLAIEYIRCLDLFRIPVEHFIYELVIDTLVNLGRLDSLRQLLQYHVVVDEKPVACQLLGLERVYQPAYQLSLDMFKRLGSSGEIYDVLLSKGDLLKALRYARSEGAEALAALPARRFLEAARDSGDDMLFFTVYTFFQQRNKELRNSPDFLPADDCGEFVKHFDVLFSSS